MTFFFFIKYNLKNKQFFQELEIHDKNKNKCIPTSRSQNSVQLFLDNIPSHLQKYKFNYSFKINVREKV